MMPRPASRPAARPARAKRSAVSKRDDARAPDVKVLPKALGAAFPAGRMLIASPLEVQAVLAKVPSGHVIRVGALRAQLARRFGADYTCPVTTGIFLRIAAEAAEEERGDGAPGALAWWRVVRDDGTLLDTLPGGRAEQARHLEREGVAVTRVRGVPRKVDAVDDIAVVPRVGRAKTAAVHA
ncbi:MAG: MGMT family protein [Gemmatimonadaceae bacterium]|jgi:hypothetical protein|nr:MGMT family protein [Gemmatimonadaceae bacterium]